MRKCITRMFAVLAITLCFSTVFADFNSVSTAVNNFNALNDGSGAKFTISTSSTFTKPNGGVYQGETRVTVSGALPDMSAYSNKVASSDYFQTFCIQTQEYVSVGPTYYSRLSLGGSQGNAYSTSAGVGAQLLTEGAATLYRLFATGTLSNYDYTYGSGRADDASLLQSALWKLQSQTTSGVDSLTSGDWSSNKYLAALKALDPLKNWLGSYDPSTDNSGYAVLVMQNRDTNCNGAQDFLYLAKTTSSSVPEPMTIGLWAIGLGCVAMRRCRFTSKKA